MCLNIVDIQTRSIQWYTPQDKETFYDFLRLLCVHAHICESDIQFELVGTEFGIP